MKAFTVCVLIALAAGRCHAAITFFVYDSQQVINGVTYDVWDMCVEVTEGYHWTNSKLTVGLSSGHMYQDAFGHADGGPPHPMLFEYAPSVRWDTYVQGAVPYQRPDLMIVTTFQSWMIDISWGTTASTGSGLFKIAQLTFSRGAWGIISGASYSTAAPGVGVPFDVYMSGLPFGGFKYPGDADVSGFVDEDDLSILLANWRRTNVDWYQGDFNRDLVVNDDDLSILLSNWRKPEYYAAAVPEPATLGVLGVGALGMLLLRRK